MAVLEKAAYLAIDATLPKAIQQELPKETPPVGQPQVDIVKLAPQNPFVYKVTFSVLPKVELGDYKKIKIKPRPVKIDKEEIEHTLKHMQEAAVKEFLVDREVKMGDKVTIDIKMFLDKVPLEGGQSKDTMLVIGNDYIVPGLGKKLLGAKAGETREFSLPYPKDFYQKNLAGKMVDFQIKVKAVYQRELPPLNDEFAKRFGLKNLEDLRRLLKENIKKEKQREADEATEREMLEEVVKQAKIGDIPTVLVEDEAHRLMEEFRLRVESAGGKFEDYLQSIKRSRDQFLLDILPQAVQNIKISLVLRQLILDENIEVQDQEVEDFIKQVSQNQRPGDKTKEDWSDPQKRDQIRFILLNRKAIKKLKESIINSQ